MWLSAKFFVLFENNLILYHLEPDTTHYHKFIAIVMTTIMPHEIGTNYLGLLGTLTYFIS